MIPPIAREGKPLHLGPTAGADAFLWAFRPEGCVEKPGERRSKGGLLMDEAGQYLDRLIQSSREK
jgi:hypothetical protein